MWKPFNYNMRLVIFLLSIQMGYIITKAIDNPHSCDDSPENDPRLKRSDEKEIPYNSEDTTRIDPDDVANRKTFSKPNNKIEDNANDNDNVNANEFASNSNTLPQKLPLVNNVTKVPANIEERDITTDKLTTTKDALLQQNVYYKAIDPKYLIISGLSLPKPNKNITNVSKSESSVNIDLKEIKTTPLNYSNSTKEANVLNREEANDTVTEEIVVNDAATDVSNIRELREHLLDHLLDYFLNIIKEENYIHNDTRKKNGKDRMKVEEKLRNYYDPHHMDMFFDDDNDDDYYDINLDPSDSHRSNDSEEDLLDNVKQNTEPNKENVSYSYPLTQADEVDKNTAEADTSPEDLQKEALNLEQNLNISSSDSESFNDFSNVLFNTTEKPKEAFHSNVNIITSTERYISNEALNDTGAEIDSDVLIYSEEAAVIDRIEDVYDNSALTIDDYTSVEDYIDSEEFEVVKNVTVHENDRNPIVITTENGRRQNGLDNEKYSVNGTLNETFNMNNSQIGNNMTISKDIASEREHKSKKLAIQDLPNINKTDEPPCNEDDLAENKIKNSSRNSKQSFERKLRRNKNCGKLANKKYYKLHHMRSNGRNCRKSIILNLNINLI